MKATLGLSGILVTLGVVYYLYTSQMTKGIGGSAPPLQQIDVTAVRTELLALAQAERLYLVSHSTYASLAQLQAEGAYSAKIRPGYEYQLETDDGKHFEITAVPASQNTPGWPTLAIDETMRIRQK